MASNAEHIKCAEHAVKNLDGWKTAGFRWEAHPFSISARPNGSRIRLTVKQLGDCTRRNWKPSRPPRGRVHFELFTV